MEWHDPVDLASGGISCVRWRLAEVVNDFTYFFAVAIDLLQILILAVPIYYLIGFLRRTSGYRILIGLCLVLLGIELASRVLNMDEISWLLSRIAVSLPFMLVIIFQPELRRIFAEIGSRTATKSSTPEVDVVNEICNAVEALASQKIGALIAVERAHNLDEFTSVGRTLNAPVVAELLATLFYPHTPMHDGGVVIRDGIILSAGCVFPLGDLSDKRKAFGTRHRAAIGLSEATDAIVIVVSEETGLISVAYRGDIVRGIEVNGLHEILTNGIQHDDERKTSESIDAVRDATPSPEETDRVAQAIAKIKEEG